MPFGPPPSKEPYVDTLILHAIEGMAAIIVAIGGFVSAQVWRESKNAAELAQNVKDLRETITRLHGENIAEHEKLVDRIAKLEDRYRPTGWPWHGMD